jgi:hypothetical protein
MPPSGPDEQQRNMHFRGRFQVASGATQCRIAFELLKRAERLSLSLKHRDCRLLFYDRGYSTLGRRNR